jgi:hypothetical protein
VINICTDDSSQSSAVLRALIAAALFTGGTQIKPILLRKLDIGNPANPVDPVFTKVEVVSTVQEAIQVAKNCPEHCVLFSDSKISSVEVCDLLACDCAIICNSATSSATTVLQTTGNSWRLPANNLIASQ